MIDCLARMGHLDSLVVDRCVQWQERVGLQQLRQKPCALDDNRLSHSFLIKPKVTGREARARLPQTDSRAAVSSSASYSTTSATLGLSMVRAQCHLPQPALRSSAQLWPLALAHLLLSDFCTFDHVSFFPSFCFASWKRNGCGTVIYRPYLHRLARERLRRSKLLVRSRDGVRLSTQELTLAHICQWSDILYIERECDMNIMKLRLFCYIKIVTNY